MQASTSRARDFRRTARRVPRPYLRRGALVAGTRVVEVLDRGGYGTVYGVVDVATGQAAALKVLNAEHVDSVDAVLRFRLEVAAMRQIRHPHVVDVRAIGELDDGRPYFLMELLRGRTLLAEIDERGRLDPEEVFAILEPICNALEAVHAHGIVHRDVKATNVFLDRRRGVLRPVLLDFGVAKFLHGGSARITTSQHLIGTPGCMAPEQLFARDVDSRTDVFALGALAFHMLTGEGPFGSASIGVQRALLEACEPPRLSSLRPLGIRLDQVLARAMSGDPSRRHSGARAFVEDLSRAVRSPEAAPRRAAASLTIEIEAQLDGPSGDCLDAAEASVADVCARLGRQGFQVDFLTATGARMVELPPDEKAPPEATARRLEEVTAIVEAALRASKRKGVRLRWSMG
jgi:serine/threonine-protein kinase